MRMSIEDRFWSHVEIGGVDECWNWSASTTDKGYGAFGLSSPKRTVPAHRFAYELSHSNPGDLKVCHTCDNPICCNPHHLFLGTQADNMADRDKKGRQAKADKRGKRKLKPDDVREILQLLDKESDTEIAKRYGVKRIAILKIRQGKTWRWMLTTS